MPPKLKYSRKSTDSPSETHIQSNCSSMENTCIVIPSSETNLGKNSEIPVDSSYIQPTTDPVTDDGDEREYFRISRSILLFELKRKRINPDTKAGQELLEGDDVPLTTSVSWDQRLVLQDGIGTDEIGEGCLSLFAHVDSEMELSQTDITHAIRFLRYTTLHMEYHEGGSKALFEYLFPNCCLSKELASTLLKLFSLPSDALKRAFIAFYAVVHQSTSPAFTISETKTAFMEPPSLSQRNDAPFKPQRAHVTNHRIPYPSLPPRDTECYYSQIRTVLPSAFASSNDPPISDELLEYLLCDENHPTVDQSKLSASHFPEIQQFFVTIRGDLSSAFASAMGITNMNVAQQYLFSNFTEPKNKRLWVQGFESLLFRNGRKKILSDLELQSILFFLLRPPPGTELPSVNGSFAVTVDRLFLTDSPPHDMKSLWTLFIPTQPRHANFILTAFREFVPIIKHKCRDTIWTEWIFLFVEAVKPSTLPFTTEFITFHSNLIAFLTEHLTSIKSKVRWNTLILWFLDLTMDYAVHLSLHPFALERCEQNLILDFLALLFKLNLKADWVDPYYQKLKEMMNEAALSSPCPPFILTTELVSSLSNKETIEVIDRTVAHLNSNTSLTDDIILRICAFFRQSKKMNFGTIFKRLGRTKEQYVATLKTLLSLPLDILNQAPVNYLLKGRRSIEVLLDDKWEDAVIWDEY
ncbi:hypothetical protein BLNAU_12447 [Blattamonas nauphoetae]|uniref:Uncharacterized protein n=1 Tax=Blattamonas nauphoetae TaxID=2049346 RepID=A0ABQ9XM83_9EUKA|nr:hypothetical protein BLNAU_12447 [Blattamonas nauphoetae]